MRLRANRQQLHDSLDEPGRNENGDCVPRDFADWREIPSKELEKEELREMLSRAMASLRPKYRSVLILRDVQQFTIAETAAILGVKQCAVKARLFRARLQMRDAVAGGLNRGWSLGRNERIQVQAVMVKQPEVQERRENGLLREILGRSPALERSDRFLANSSQTNSSLPPR
jgi:predicted RNA polymerase sigma factor